MLSALRIVVELVSRGLLGVALGVLIIAIRTAIG